MSQLLALCASVLWGASDFTGGTASRRRPEIVVIAWSEAVALFSLVVIVTATGKWHITPALIGWGCGAGLSGLLGVIAFYRGLAQGAMGVVAPIAATGVVVPVVVGAIMGQNPSTGQYAGVAVGILGVVLVSRPPSQDGAPVARGRKIVGLSGIAAIAFGFCFVFIDRAEPHGTLMTLVMMRMATLIAITAYVVATRQPMRVRISETPMLGFVGGADVGANACFAQATLHGSLGVVSVLASLYPALTTLLARVVHSERLGRIQLVGIGLTLAAVALLASGPSG